MGGSEPGSFAGKDPFRGIPLSRSLLQEIEKEEKTKRIRNRNDTAYLFWRGYFGEGDLSARDPNWWAPPMDEMSIYSMFDDELTFRFEGNVYGLSANGAVYCDASAREAMGLEEGKTGDIA